LRFNNNTTALIFGSFHQGKEQRFLLLESIHTPTPNSLIEKKTLIPNTLYNCPSKQKKEQLVKLQKLNI
jgi:hypothetical protein